MMEALQRKIQHVVNIARNTSQDEFATSVYVVELLEIFIAENAKLKENNELLEKALEIAFSFENGIENDDHCVNSGDNPVAPEWCTPQCIKCKVVYALKKTAREGG